MGKNTTFPAVSQPSPADFQEIISISFFSIVDCGATQFGDPLQNMIDEYNKKCPTNTITDKLGRTRTYRRGLLRGNQTLVARELIYTCFQQMEELRNGSTQNQKRYYDYVTGAHVDGLPVMMNRGWIRSKIRKAACKTSIWNYLNQLIDAGIILQKQNTSRVRQEIIEDGHKTVIVDMNSNGRGDFILWLNVNLFAWKLQKSHFIDAKGNQIQKLDQSIYDLNNTSKKEDNNCSKGVPVGTTNSFSPDATASATNKPNENGKVKNSAAAPRPVAPGEKNILQGEARIRQLRQETRISDNLPQKESVFWVTMLYHQLVNMLYPDLDRRYLVQVEKQVKELLYLHMVRLELPAKDAFAKVSRGIEMAQIWLQQNPERYLYEPLTYLRLDEEYTTGTFRTVMDRWVTEESRRLKVINTKNQNLVKWQKAHAKMESLFKDVLHSLHVHGFTHSKKTFEAADRQLAMYFGKLHLSETTRAKVRRSFTDRCTTIFKALREHDHQKYENDRLNDAFQDWLKNKTA